MFPYISRSLSQWPNRPRRSRPYKRYTVYSIRQLHYLFWESHANITLIINRVRVLIVEVTRCQIIPKIYDCDVEFTLEFYYIYHRFYCIFIIRIPTQKVHCLYHIIFIIDFTKPQKTLETWYYNHQVYDVVDFIILLCTSSSLNYLVQHLKKPRDALSGRGVLPAGLPP